MPNIPPPAPRPNLPDEPPFQLDIDRDFVVFPWRHGARALCELNIKNNSPTRDPFAFKVLSPHPYEEDDPRSEKYGVEFASDRALEYGESTTIVFYQHCGQAPLLDEHYFTIVHKRCHEFTVDMGLDVWHNNPRGDGYIHIPVTLELGDVKIEGGHGVRKLPDTPITVCAMPPAPILNLPHEPRFGLTTNKEYLEFLWYSYQSDDEVLRIVNTSNEYQCYKVYVPDARNIFTVFPPNHSIGYLSPGKARRIVIRLDYHRYPKLTESHYVVVKHKACTAEEAYASVTIKDGEQFWRDLSSAPDGVKKIPIISWSHSVAHKYPEGPQNNPQNNPPNAQQNPQQNDQQNA